MINTITTPYKRTLPPDPASLDRLADAELQHGHHARAEQLAEMALALRDALQ